MPPEEMSGDSSPLDPSKLTLVGRGAGQVLSWELYDGPHPLAGHPDAVGDTIDVIDARGGGGGGGGVSERLRPHEIASLSWHASEARNCRPCWLLAARCAPSVTAAVVHHDDTSTVRIEAMASTTTGQHWIVCCVESQLDAVGIDFLDPDEKILESKPLTKPQLHRHRSRLGKSPVGRTQDWRHGP